MSTRVGAMVESSGFEEGMEGRESHIIGARGVIGSIAFAPQKRQRVFFPFLRAFVLYFPARNARMDRREMHLQCTIGRGSGQPRRGVECATHLPRN